MSAAVRVFREGGVLGLETDADRWAGRPHGIRVEAYGILASATRLISGY
jgi:hypothetical protein